MPAFCMALMLLPGRTDDFRAFAAEVHGPRRAEYVASERRLGMIRENWHLQHTPQGDLWLLYLESPDLNRTIAAFILSPDPFDRWFRQQVLELTGLDFSVPPPDPLSECVGSYEASSN